MREITLEQFKERFPKAYERWVDALVLSSEDDFFETDDGRPGYSTDGGYGGNPSFVWDPEQDDFEEEYPEEDMED